MIYPVIQYRPAPPPQCRCYLREMRPSVTASPTSPSLHLYHLRREGQGEGVELEEMEEVFEELEVSR